MMINWAEKQAPEDRQLTTEDVADAMTQYGVEEPREAIESEDEQEQRGQRELLQAVTTRGRLDEEGDRRTALAEP